MPVIIDGNRRRHELPTELPHNPPGPIERRYVDPTIAPDEARLEQLRSRQTTYIPTAEDRRRAAASVAQQRAERLARPKEGPTVSDDLSPLERLSEAARRAHEAHEEKLVAEEAWRVAQEALTIAWRDLPPEVLDWSRILPSGATPASTSLHLVARTPAPIAPAKPKRQPGRHPSKASEAKEKAERAEKVMAAMERLGGDQRAVAAELGMRPNAVAMVVKHARARAEAGE
jgi:hypothetical protein